MTRLYLDDVRTPTEKGWVIVRSYQEFKEYLDNNDMPDIISFDHDLAAEHYHNDMYKGQKEYSKLYAKFSEKTGMDCAKYLGHLTFTNGGKFPTCNVHSMNPAGAKNIRDYLLAAMLYHEGSEPNVTMEKIPCTTI